MFSILISISKLIVVHDYTDVSFLGGVDESNNQFIVVSFISEV